MIARWILCALVLSLTVPASAQPVCVSGNCDHEHHNSDTTVINKKAINIGPAVIAAVVAFIVWLFWPEKEAKALPPVKDPDALKVAPPRHPETFLEIKGAQ